MAEAEPPANKKDRESSVRWQGRTIEQFGYSLNLILGLSVATLGFETALVLNKILSESWMAKLFVGLSALSLLLSSGLGLWCVVIRLSNFRTTAVIARKREKNPVDVELKSLRILSRKLGERTWEIFKWQIVTFGLGVILLVVVIAPRLLDNVK